MLSNTLTEQEKHDAIKQKVLQHFHISGHTPDILMDMSEEEYRLDVSGEWLFDSMETHMEHGREVTEVHLNQPLRGISVAGVASFLHNPEHMLDEAFELHGDDLCVCQGKCRS